MNNQTIDHSSQDFSWLMEFFSKPEAVTQRILSAPFSFYKDEKSDAELFWKEFEALIRQHEDLLSATHYPFLRKLQIQQYFYHLKSTLEAEIRIVREKIIFYNPSTATFVKSVFLVVELGKLHQQYNVVNKLHGANFQSLSAAKSVISRFAETKRSGSENEYSPELGEWVLNLLRWQIDLNNLLKIHDELIWSDFEIQFNEMQDGFVISTNPELPKSKNLYILHELKRKAKLDYLFSRSFSSLSDESHFRKVDPVFKTNEGLVTVLHSPGLKLTNQTPGTTSMEVPHAFFESIFNEDSSHIKEEAQIALLTQISEAAFHYHLRTALADAYRPNDVVDVKKLSIVIKNKEFKVYDLLCAAAALSSLAERVNYFNLISRFDIPSLFEKYSVSKDVQKKDWGVEMRLEQFTSYVIHRFKELEEKEITSPFVFKNREYLINLLRKVEELKHLSKEVLVTIIDFFSGDGKALPFLPIYKTEEDYLIETSALSLHSYVRIVYDYFVAEELFGGKSNKTKSTFSNQRERDFNSSLQQTLQQLTKFCEAGVDFKKPKRNNKPLSVNGETDLFAYFENEHLLMPIQVKLSNTFPKKERKKYDWVKGHISEAASQIERDLKVIESEDGLKWIAKELGTTINRKGLKVVPLIVTDNFYMDHVVIPLGSKDKVSLCVSLFEIKNLIEGNKVSTKQAEWSFSTQKKPGSYLIKLLNENFFWKFLEKEAEEYKDEIIVSSLNAPNKLKRMI